MRQSCSAEFWLGCSQVRKRTKRAIIAPQSTRASASLRAGSFARLARSFQLGAKGRFSLGKERWFEVTNTTVKSSRNTITPELLGVIGKELYPNQSAISVEYRGAARAEN